MDRNLAIVRFGAYMTLLLSLLNYGFAANGTAKIGDYIAINGLLGAFSILGIMAIVCAYSTDLQPKPCSSSNS